MSNEPVSHILSYGGGVNTVALMIVLTEEGAPLDEVVFADTGDEVPETYSYLDVTKEYLSARGVPFRVVQKPNRKSLYETCWDRNVFPSAIWRWSTRDFKVNPIQSYYRRLGGHINQYMGIAYDEVMRVKDSRVSYVTNLYPLIDRGMTRADCESVISQAGLPIPVKSGCFFCPFNSVGRWRWLQDNHRDLFDKAVVLEENSKHYPSQRLTDQVYRHRATVTLRQLGESIADDRGILGEPETESLCGGECMT